MRDQSYKNLVDYYQVTADTCKIFLKLKELKLIAENHSSIAENLLENLFMSSADSIIATINAEEITLVAELDIANDHIIG